MESVENQNNIGLLSCVSYLDYLSVDGKNHPLDEHYREVARKSLVS
jgi:hypothetical protein